MISIEYPLIWEQDVVDKIWEKHHLFSEEADEALFDDKPICHKYGEKSYCIYGQSIGGKYLFIVLKRGKGRGKYKVITARKMEDKERRYYRKRVR